MSGIRIYATGGTGINIGSAFYNVVKSDGFAEIKTCFVDTSLSNIRDKVGKVIDEDDVFLLEGVDGSGKLRKSNAQELVKIVKPVLHKFKPEDLNIVVFSASGGTGSVCGYYIAKELLEKDHNVICIVIGSEESKITIENTVKTLQSLDTLSRNIVKKPVTISYWHNNHTTTRQQNDASVKQTITALSILASKENKELDTADVSNFINFQNVTSVTEGIAMLYVTSEEKAASEIEYPISIASLFSTYGDAVDGLTPEYSCVGYPPNDVLKESDLHFIISQYDVKNTFTRLAKRLDEFNETSSARISTTALGGNADTDGIVL